MTRRLCLLFACALALVTGCGGSSSPSTTTGGVSSATISALKQNQARSLANCRSDAANPGQSAAQKTLIEAECAAIQTGNATALRAAGTQLCTLEAAALPAAQRKGMLASCKAQVK